MSAEKKISITVAAKQASRLRAGMAFGTEPRTVEVTEAQLEAIKADPLLAIMASDKADDKAEGKKPKS